MDAWMCRWKDSSQTAQRGNRFVGVGGRVMSTHVSIARDVGRPLAAIVSPHWGDEGDSSAASHAVRGVAKKWRIGCVNYLPDSASKQGDFVRCLCKTFSITKQTIVSQCQNSAGVGGMSFWRFAGVSYFSARIKHLWRCHSTLRCFHFPAKEQTHKYGCLKQLAILVKNEAEIGGFVALHLNRVAFLDCLCISHCDSGSLQKMASLSCVVFTLHLIDALYVSVSGISLRDRQRIICMQLMQHHLKFEHFNAHLYGENVIFFAKLLGFAMRNAYSRTRLFHLNMTRRKGWTASCTGPTGNF